MSKEYTIPSKPTKYNGRQYRSRLEARFAAFFDLCEFSYEYEPMDLPGWSPDFILYKKIGKHDALVEIKPSQDFFDITKYLTVDFDKYNVWLMTPQMNIMLSKDGIDTAYFTADGEFGRKWIESANQVMFLKPL